VLVLSGLVAALNLVLSAVVGWRLLSRGRREASAPELSLGVYFVMSAVVGTIPQIVVYSGLTDPALRVPEPVARVLLGIAIFGMAAGAAGVYVFTWKTFRPDRPWAKGIVAAGIATLAAGFVWEAWAEGFAPVVFAGPGHWLGWAGRTAAMLGVAFESFRYWGMQRRRLRLGLADPVVANRFLLWGIWATAGTLNYVADLAARGVYVLVTGTTTELVPHALGPLVGTTISVTMVLGAVSAATLFLTFFPTEGYRRWLASRTPAEA